MGRFAPADAVDRVRFFELRLWLLAVALFGVGDVVTTTVGLGLAGVREIGPLTAILLDQYGLWSMLVTKSLVLGGFYLLWRHSPREYRVGVPLGLALLGAVVVGWNSIVGLAAIQ